MKTLMLAAALLAAVVSPAFADANIVIKNFDFMPMNVTIKTGEAVVWKNADGEPHTVTSVDGAFRSGALDQGESYRFVFAKPGTYKYLCSIHPRMVGVITVK